MRANEILVRAASLVAFTGLSLADVPVGIEGGLSSTRQRVVAEITEESE